MDGNDARTTDAADVAGEQYEAPTLTEHSEWDVVTGSIGSGIFDTR